jgi:hypothetical protein
MHYHTTRSLITYYQTDERDEDKYIDNDKMTEYRIVETPKLEALYCLAPNNSNIKIVCVGVDGLTHFDIIFPPLPFTYKKINNPLGNLIKYTRHIDP